MLVERDYFALVKHMNMVLRKRLWHGVAEEGVVKWMWGSFGVSQFSSQWKTKGIDLVCSCASAQFLCSSSCPALGRTTSEDELKVSHPQLWSKLMLMIY